MNEMGDVCGFDLGIIGTKRELGRSVRPGAREIQPILRIAVFGDRRHHPIQTIRLPRTMNEEDTTDPNALPPSSEHDHKRRTDLPIRQMSILCFCCFCEQSPPVSGGR